MKKVFIDLGNVLCHFNHSKRLQIMSNAFGMDTKVLNDIFWKSGFDQRGDQGQYSIHEMCDFVRQKTCSTLDNLEISKLWASAFTPNEEVIALAKALSTRCNRILLTDNSPLVELGISTVFTEIDECVDEKFFSYRLQDQKSNRSIYSKIINKYQCSPSEMLLIDDNSSVLSTAEEVGIHTIHYTKPMKIDTKVNEFLM